jgi:CubicO group peptidase (beta-lactamase class C family)
LARFIDRTGYHSHAARVNVVAEFRAGIDRGIAPGGQLVLSKNGERIVDEAYGTATPDLDHDLASLTKVLATCWLVGRARQYGLCDLDDPLSRFIPAAAEGVTLRHCLEHTSGYPAHKHFYETLSGYEPIVAAAARTPLASEPGTRIVYSDLGFILLGAALERMFAEPLRALITEKTHGVFYPSGEDRPFATTAHLGAAEDRPPIPTPPGVVHDGNCRAMGGASGHAGLFGSAREVMALAERWLGAHRGEDTAFMQKRFVDELFAPARVPGRATGFDMTSPGGHTGDVWPSDTVGHLGFTGTSLWMSPSQRLICVLVTNRQRPMAELKAYRRAVYAAAVRA